MEINLNLFEKYDYPNVESFRKLTDKYGSFSNMSHEYGIELFGERFIASEILFIMAGFRDETIQRKLLEKQSNPTVITKASIQWANCLRCCATTTVFWNTACRTMW
ncbi:MAG: hypothetical protein LBK97_01145 [Prevotellaceae bacterium]|jgi:predicted NAD-dependent protein-ADP-ribosyltransferase YbiA (DUF1768 family)|nr:hypothetical protein [Prevotellaceae bacterium]